MGAECFCAAEGLSDEDHTELNIKYITLSIYHGSCQVWSAGAVKKKKQEKNKKQEKKKKRPIQKTDSVPADCKWRMYKS